MNIYMKQMKKLGLTPKQYAKLINMPYKVVKDFIYEKEGEYSMDIKNILRNDMIKKHQEIEQNKENSKMKALEIKNNDYEFDFLGWYYNEYTKEMLFDKLKELIDSKNDILRKLLINRLTEEEKMLIELFGGKIC